MVVEVVQLVVSRRSTVSVFLGCLILVVALVVVVPLEGVGVLMLLWYV